MATVTTSMTSSEITFQWTTIIPENSHNPIASPTFTTVDGIWHLHLEFKNHDVGLFLMPTNIESSPTLRFSLGVYQEGELRKLVSYVRKFVNKVIGFGCIDIVKRPSEATTITFGVKIFASSNTLIPPLHADSLSTIFDDAETSDVEFHIENRCIYAHKAILISRSPYFRTKFKNGFGETITPKDKDSQRHYIEMSEDYEAFRLLLYHLYTGRVSIPSITVEAKKVLEISSKYEAEELCLAMEENMVRQLSKENISEILFDYGYKYSNIKRECLEYITGNYKENMDIEEFKRKLGKFVNEVGNGEFIVELLSAITK